MSIENLITDHLETWTTAQVPKKSGGRGRGKKTNGQNSYGINKLRELILELAVRGKLVPQDPNDEPAPELLKKIATERARLVKDGKIKKHKPLPDISEDEKPFELPNGWEWSRLVNVIEVIRGITFPSSEKSKIPEDGRVACLRTSNVQNRIEWEDILYIRRQFVKRKDQYIQINDIVMSMANSRELVGKVAIIEKQPPLDTAFGGFLGVLRPTILNPFYVMLLLRVPMNRRLLIDGANQTTNIANISIANLNPLVLPIPPLAEQHRIVDKVDELMALCDKLEQEQTNNSETHQLLVKTLLDTLTHAKDHQDFIETWQQIEKNFDILFTTEASIDELKQTILQLAVMGKLVPQDPNDEPASVLLEKIAKEKARLVKEGKIKKQKPLPPIGENEKPFELPMGWERVSLRHLGIFSGGKTPSKAKSVYWDGDIPWVTSKDMKVKHIIGSEDHVTQRAIEDGLAIYHPEAILFVVRSGILRHSFPVAVTKVDCTVNQDIKVLSLFLADLSPYIYLMMRGFEKYILLNLSKSGMTVESIMFQEFSDHYFILPPLTEQYRIVAKVDELMAICDSLKERLNDAQTTQVQLADAILGQVAS